MYYISLTFNSLTARFNSRFVFDYNKYNMNKKPLKLCTHRDVLFLFKNIKLRHPF